MNWYYLRRIQTDRYADWPSDPAHMTAEQADTALWVYHRSSDCPDVSYTDGDHAIRCAMALKQGCIGLPKCNPSQCLCGAIRNPGVPSSDVQRGWTTVVIRQ